MVNGPVQNIPQTAPPFSTPPARKKRHGCLTAWLIIIIIFNAIGVLGGALLAIGSEFLGLDMPAWIIGLNIVLSLAAIGFAVALFMWKKWGFWGLAAVEVVIVIINILEGNYLSIVSGVISIALLLLVLNIGNENKGWPQLE